MKYKMWNASLKFKAWTDATTWAAMLPTKLFTQESQYALTCRALYMQHLLSRCDKIVKTANIFLTDNEMDRIKPKLSMSSVVSTLSWKLPVFQFRAILFGELHKTWAVIKGDAGFLVF